MSDPRVYFWRDAPASLAEAEEELATKLRLRALKLGYWAVFDRAALAAGGSDGDAFPGQVCAQPLKFTDEIEFGYAFAPEAWGKAIATEASVALIRHIFAVTDLDRLAAIVMPENAPSIRVMDRLGFTARDEGLYGSNQALHIYFELSRRDFVTRDAHQDNTADA